MSVDQSITFKSVGGLNSHVKSLREMVVLPLLYPEVFAKFGVTPPRGVLFYGPPGKHLLTMFIASAKGGDNKIGWRFFVRLFDCLLAKLYKNCRINVYGIKTKIKLCWRQNLTGNYFIHVIFYIGNYHCKIYNLGGGIVYIINIRRNVCSIYVL